MGSCLLFHAPFLHWTKEDLYVTGQLAQGSVSMFVVASLACLKSSRIGCATTSRCFAARSKARSAQQTSVIRNLSTFTV
jgi:hypothetical protein